MDLSYSFLTSAYGFSFTLKLAKSKLVVWMLGQLMTIATERLISISSMVYPALLNAEAWPAMRPPLAKSRLAVPGAAITAVMPLARVTGMWALAGFTAVAATSPGLFSPSLLPCRVGV